MNWFAAMRLWLDYEPPSPLPPHVQAVKLDHKIALHIAGAEKPSSRTQSGFIKPRTEQGPF